MELTPAKNPPKGGRNTECRKLRIEYHQDTDCFCIAHYSGDGVLLSEARLSGEDALDYAKTIEEVYDRAFNIE